MKRAGYENSTISGFSAKVLQHFEGRASGYMRSALDDLEHSIKFALGPVSDLVDFSQTDKPDKIQLPFDLMAVECETVEGEDIVCVFKRTGPVTVKFFVFIKGLTDPGFSRLDWCVPASWVEVDTSCNGGGMRICNQEEVSRVAELNGVEEAEVRRCVKGLAQRAWLVLSALNSLLECRNIDTERIAPPIVTGLGRKKRKLLRFEYHVLVIRNHIANGRPGYSGSHRSPRFHMRRGHIMRHPTAGKIWRSPCVVGSPENGSIAKDYRVEVRP